MFSKPRHLGRWGLAGLGFVLVLGLYLGFHPGDLRSRWSFGTQVLDRHGELLRVTLAADGKYRAWYPLEEYRPSLVQALLLKEDRNYWIHPGVDFQALARAAWHSFGLGDYRAGGSTLTMQLARLVYRLDTSTIPGKLNQILQALRLSVYYSKSDLLELYLNLAPCGGNVEGLGTAARIYYGRNPGRLSLSEEMALVVLPQDPAGRNPLVKTTWPDITKARDMLILRWQVVHGTHAELRDRLGAPLDFRPQLPFLAPHFVNWVLKEAGSPVLVPTTLDLGLQKILERKVNQYIDRNRAQGVKNAVVMLAQWPSMEVLAQVGSADFFNRQIDGQVDGTGARRSPGSTLKPFIYALALDQGLIHPATVLKDTKTHFGAYNPDNYDNDFDGPISASEALRRSRNIPAVTLARDLDTPGLYGFLRNAGVDLPFPEEHYGLSLVLGGAEVTMRELMGLYGALAGDGTTRTPVNRIIPGGSPGKRLFSSQSAFLVRRMLLGRSNPETTEDRDLPQVAFKTGTSIGFRDSWSMAVFNSLVLGVWVGDFQGGSTTQFVGLRTAAPLMNDIVEALRADPLSRPLLGKEMPPPEDLVQVRVCTASGALAGEHCSRTSLGWFIPGISPIDVCKVHQSLPIDRITGLRRSQDGPTTRREVFEVWSSDIMEIFAKAGIMRRTPPRLDPRDQLEAEPGTGVFRILMPVKGQTYFVRAGMEEERIPLIGDTDSQATRIYWFLGEKFLGQAPRGTPFFWKPEPGNHNLKAVDDLGRTAETKFYLRSR